VAQQRSEQCGCQSIYLGPQSWGHKAKFVGVRQLSNNFCGCPDIHVTHSCCAYESEALICFFQLNNLCEKTQIWMVTSNPALKCLVPTLYGIFRTRKIVDNTVMNIPRVWRKEGITSIATSHGPTYVNVL
jgi:hypothetical protein